MLATTESIVLSSLSYTDSSIIVKLYTKEFGFVSGYAKGIHGKKSKTKANIFQPASIIDVVYYSKENNSLKNIKEAKINFPYAEIPFHPIKSAIVFFSTEFFQKIIKESEPNFRLYDFVRFYFTSLDKRVNNYANFPILYLIKLSSYLGFSPFSNYSEETPIFNISEGMFVAENTQNRYLHLFADIETSLLLHQLLQKTFRDIKDADIPHTKRGVLIELLLNYYSVHTGISINLKSIDIIKSVLH
ncbi:MAG: DNA repair protein RecO [Bacteroidetes bacterium]|nr:DNA repair protein RecO [Bacteroidota bacterium]